MQRTGDALVTRYAYAETQSKLVNQRTGVERSFDPLAASGTFAPDDSRLVYTAYLSRTNETELRFYEPSNDTQGVLTTLAGRWGWLPHEELLWSEDGDQLLLYEMEPSGRQPRVALLNKDGSLVAELALPHDVAVLAILPNDQLLVSRRHQWLVQSLALQPGVSRRYPAILLPAKIAPSSVVYVPPSP
ncbi:MAG: hypothetical protein H7Y32_06875 [Chloroflexales bacterium]|nr:hypothetical protein [Chloroflexales bacterium]